MWKIKTYVSPSEKNDVQSTYDAGTDDIKAELEVELEYLKVRGREEWRRPHAAKLTKCDKFRDFFEIRFFANRLQQRPIGYFGPNPNEFTILIWATEKGGKLIPADWCTKANQRRINLMEGTAKAVPLKLDGSKNA